MKSQNQDLFIWILFILLGCSIIINLIQDMHVNRLTEEMEEMEYVHDVLSAQIDELEGEHDVVLELSDSINANLKSIR